jgi:hypothetical protein
MRRTCVVILLSSIFGLLLDNPASGSEVTALKIRDKIFEPESQELRYQLWNESDKTITAWRLSLARSDPHGHAQKSILDQDFFDVDQTRATRRPGPLDPGRITSGSWRLDIGDEQPGITALSVKVVAVIFEDSTWQGSSRAAQAILESREARVEEIGKVLSSLESGQGRFRTRENLTATLQQQSRLLRQQGEDRALLSEGRRESAAQVSATRLELAQWLEDASREISLAADPTETMGHLTGALQRRYDNGLEAVRSRQRHAESAANRGGGDQ